MPQMSPMNWLLLFFYFSLIFLMNFIVTYYMVPLKKTHLQPNNILDSQFNISHWNW